MILAPRQRSRGHPSSANDHRQLVMALEVPRAASGLVLMVQVCGSVRSGLLAQGIAPLLRSTGLATCVVNLVESDEAEHSSTLSNLRFLSNRINGVVEFLAMDRATGHLPLAILGRDEAAPATIRLAAEQPDRVRALVSCSGRPQLAGIDCAGYRVPTLLLVPGAQRVLLRANEKFFLQLHCEGQLAVIQGASRIGEFDNLAACQKVIHSWCVRYLGLSGRSPPTGELPRKSGRRYGQAAPLGALVHG